VSHKISFGSVFRKNSILGFDIALSCITLDALSRSFLTITVTLDAKCVKCIASSIAASHHHTIAICLSRKTGNHQSQIAQADTHLHQKLASHKSHILFAVAQVAIIIDLVSITSLHIYTLNGFEDKSTLSTVLVSIFVHEFNDCCLIFFIR
jgi:hypothetical protein